jgi:hypothetical protein
MKAVEDAAYKRVRDDQMEMMRITNGMSVFGVSLPVLIGILDIFAAERGVDRWKFMDMSLEEIKALPRKVDA